MRRRMVPFNDNRNGGGLQKKAESDPYRGNDILRAYVLQAIAFHIQHRQYNTGNYI